MNSLYILPVSLQFIGVIVIIAEVILPSGGILSILAALVFGFSLFRAFSISNNIGMLFASIDIVMVPLLVLLGLKLLAKSPATLRTTLSRKEGVISQNRSMDSFLSMSGVAVTDLRPAGSIKINDQKLDAVTKGEYIDKGSQIHVIEITGNQVIVKEK